MDTMRNSVFPALHGITYMCVSKMRDLCAPLRNKISDSKSQRKLIMVIVCVALLLDNMLYMVIVPIITEYFKKEPAATTTITKNNFMNMTPTLASFSTQSGSGIEAENFDAAKHDLSDNGTLLVRIRRSFTLAPPPHEESNEDVLIGILFASKAIVQLMANIFTGSFIDRVGYVTPLTMGLTVMFISTALFACATTFGLLFFARSLQGVGSALADTACFGLIADRFQDEVERSKALGIALAFISFGSLVAPPFGGVLCEFAGREWPFLILAFVCLIDAMLLLLVQIPAEDEEKAKDGNLPVGTPMWKLLIDPYIAVIAVSLMVANFPLAFLEPTIAKWMEVTMGANKWQVGLVWLPAFFPHVLGVFITVRLSTKYFRYQWLYGAIGLVCIGVATAAVPTCHTYGILILPLAILCFGIALIDTALLPTLAFLVDVRHTSVYGSVYAIADMSYSIAYALGPVLAGQAVHVLGYLKMNVGIGIVNMMFAPLLLFLREVYDWKPDRGERVNLLDPDNAPVDPINDPTYVVQRPISKTYSTSDEDQEFTPVPKSNASRATSRDIDEMARNIGTARPRPRPRKHSKVVAEVVTNGTYSTTVLSGNTDGIAANGDLTSFRPTSQTSLSKGDFQDLAKSGIEVRNPIFENDKKCNVGKE